MYPAFNKNSWYNFCITLTYPLALIFIFFIFGKQKFIKNVLFYPGIEQKKPEKKSISDWKKNLKIIHFKTPSFWIILWLEIPVALAFLIYEFQYWIKFIFPSNSYFDLLNGWMVFKTDPVNLATLFAFVFFVSIIESIFFHGLLQGLLKKLYIKKAYIAGIIWINFLFALGFMNIWQSLPMFFVGLLLSWIRNATKSIWSVISIRIASTFFLIIIEWVIRKPDLLQNIIAKTNEPHVPYWLTFISLFMLINACHYIYKRSRRLEAM